MDQPTERRYLGIALLLAGVVSGMTAVLLLQRRGQTARAVARNDHDTGCRDMVDEGGAVMDDGT